MKMINKIKLLILSCISLSFAQDYFPMHMGDWWEFHNNVTNQYSQYTIIDTSVVSGYTYFQFEGYPLFFGLYRKDSLNNLLRFNTNDSTCCDTIYKLNATAGDTWVIGDLSYPLTICTYVGLNSYGDKQFHVVLPFGIEEDHYLGENWGLKLFETEGSVYYSTGAYVNGVYLDIIDENVNRPEIYYTIFPNPFNAKCQIQFADFIINGELEIFNILGQKVNKFFISGQSVQWDGKDFFGNTLSSGSYFAVLNSSNELYIKKITLLK